MIREGTNVKWRWGEGWGKGTVIEIHHEKIRRTLQGAEVTRDGSDGDPAYVIEQNDGDQVMKLRSEVERDD